MSKKIPNSVVVGKTFNTMPLGEIHGKRKQTKKLWQKENVYVGKGRMWRLSFLFLKE